MPLTERPRLWAPRPDLGLRVRSRSWRELLDPQGLKRDAGLGLALAASTLPLSILLATLSGAPASAGLISAVVGSLVCALIGGTRVSLSGPGLTSALVTSSIILRHGFEGLGVVILLAGLLQVLTGALGLGRFVRLVPLSVIRASVFGMGVALLLWQLPHALGPIDGVQLPVLTGSGGVLARLPRIDPVVVALAAGAGLLGLVGAWRSWFPGGLLALVIATLVSALLGLEVPTVHEAASFPLPRALDAGSTGLPILFFSALELWGALTLGTAISSAALDQLRADSGLSLRSVPSQELIGNGIATVGLAFLQGLPATQLIVRSAVGVRLDVRSPRPAIVQALVVLVVGAAAWPLLHLIPLAALTGIAVSVALPLLDPRPLAALRRVSQIELWLCLSTVVTMVLGGIATGLLVGLALAFGVAALRMARTRALVHHSHDPAEPHQVSFSGPVTFLAALELEKLRSQLVTLEPARGLVMDLRSVVTLDGNGALSLVSALDEWRARGGKVALLGPSAEVQERLEHADEIPRLLPGTLTVGALKSAIAPNDRAVDAILEKTGVRLSRPRLLAGVSRFREEKRKQYDSLFSQLADGQDPHTLFITCVDSRIDPALLMGSHPGDLFIVRTLGALVPPYGTGVMPQEGAAVEYGVGVLGVRTIVVCGHSRCGAISALRKGEVPAELATLGLWAKNATEIAGDVRSHPEVDAATRAVMVRQLAHLMSYPIVREKHASGELQVHAWFYDIGQFELVEWDQEKGTFIELGAEAEVRDASKPGGPEPLKPGGPDAPEPGAPETPKPGAPDAPEPGHLGAEKSQA